MKAGNGNQVRSLGSNRSCAPETPLSSEAVELVNLVAKAMSSKIANDLAHANDLMHQSVPRIRNSAHMSKKWLLELQLIREMKLDEALKCALGGVKLYKLGVRKEICVNIRSIGKLCLHLYPKLKRTEIEISTNMRIGEDVMFRALPIELHTESPSFTTSPSSSNIPLFTPYLVPGKLIQLPLDTLILEPALTFIRTFIDIVKSASIVELSAMDNEVFETLERLKRLHRQRNGMGKREQVCMFRLAEEDFEWSELEERKNSKGGTGEREMGKVFVARFGWLCGCCEGRHTVQVLK